MIVNSRYCSNICCRQLDRLFVDTVCENIQPSSFLLPFLYLCLFLSSLSHYKFLFIFSITDSCRATPIVLSLLQYSPHMSLIYICMFVVTLVTVAIVTIMSSSAHPIPLQVTKQIHRKIWQLLFIAAFNIWKVAVNFNFWPWFIRSKLSSAWIFKLAKIMQHPPISKKTIPLIQRFSIESSTKCTTQWQGCAFAFRSHHLCDNSTMFPYATTVTSQ